MNRLEMSLQQSIVTLWSHGWSFRRIARELGIRRETASKYVHQHESVSKPAKVPAGSSVRTRSQCEPWRDPIERALQAGLSAQRIFQDLVADHQFGGGYDAVKRFVRHLDAGQPLPFRRMECAPAQEMQVDFGRGAWIRVEGKCKRPYLFRVVLSHSRKGYSEVVWHQSTENFIRCLENAFRAFGGVPQGVGAVGFAAGTHLQLAHGTDRPARPATTGPVQHRSPAHPLAQTRCH